MGTPSLEKPWRQPIPLELCGPNYNESAVSHHFSRHMRPIALVAFLGVLLSSIHLPGQNIQAPGPGSTEAAAATAGKDRILLILPFDNRTGQPSLEGFAKLRRRC
jgi:hypothetical protein